MAIKCARIYCLAGEDTVNFVESSEIFFIMKLQDAGDIWLMVFAWRLDTIVNGKFSEISKYRNWKAGRESVASRLECSTFF